jgi:hypothetical protein
MELTTISKREFLKNGGKIALGAAIGVAGMNATKIFADDTYPWPWTYAILDPDQARIIGHDLYWNDKDCSSGVFGALLTLLQKAVGAPWTNIPMEVVLYGRGGGASWGTLCGTLNGGAAMISLCVNKNDSTALINELWGYYMTESMPTQTANDFAVQGKYTVQKYNDPLISNVSGSPLCHPSVSQWCFVANKKTGDTERKERCARIVGDIAVKTVEILNAYFNKTFVATFKDSDGVNGCLSCHGSSGQANVFTHMECSTCHPNPHASGVIENTNKSASEYKIMQNYPNPFSGSTTIQFSIPKEEKVQIEVYDMRGDVFATLIDYELYQAGTYSITYNGMDDEGKRLVPGIYFCRMIAGPYLGTIKMNVV